MNEYWVCDLFILLYAFLECQYSFNFSFEQTFTVAMNKRLAGQESHQQLDKILGCIRCILVRRDSASKISCSNQIETMWSLSWILSHCVQRKVESPPCNGDSSVKLILQVSKSGSIRQSLRMHELIQVSITASYAWPKMAVNVLSGSRHIQKCFQNLSVRTKLLAAILVIACKRQHLWLAQRQSNWALLNGDKCLGLQQPHDAGGLRHPQLRPVHNCL